MLRTKKFYLVLLFLLTALFITGCEKKNASKSIELDAENYSLAIGEEKTVKVDYLVGGKVSQDKVEFDYKSNDDSVVTFTNGKLVGIAAGKANITVSLKSDNTVKDTAVVTVTAKLSNITVDLDGGTLDKNITTYQEGTKLVLPTPTKNGCSFKGWLLNGEIVTEIGANVTGDVTIKALWQNGSEGKSSITFELDGGTLNNAPEYYVEGQRFSLDNLEPTKQGYNFVFWHLGDEEEITEIPATQKGPIKIYALWDKIRIGYTVSYATSGGTVATGAPTFIEKGQTYTLPEVTRDGFNFTGWYYNGQLITEFPQLESGNIELRAGWDKILIKHTLTFTLNDGVLADGVTLPTEYAEGEAYVLPAISKEDYNFLGWFVGDTKITEVDRYQNTDLTIVAKFEAKPKTNCYIGTENYGTLAKALLSAKDGDVIRLDKGVFDDELTIDKKVTIIGPNMNVKGNAERTEEAVITGKVTITSDNVVINGVKFSDNGAIHLAANNIEICYIYTDATPTSAAPSNRYGTIINDVVVENISIHDSYLCSGSNTTQRDCLAFNFEIKNLNVYNNFFTNTAAKSGVNEAIIAYSISGTLRVSENIFWFGTTNFVAYLGVNADKCTKLEFKDNYVGGANGTESTSGVCIQNVQPDARLVLEHNTFSHVTGNVLKFAGSQTGSFIDVKYNYYKNTQYKVTSAGAATFTYEGNYYANGVTADSTVVADDKDLVYADEAAFEAAYKLVAVNNASSTGKEVNVTTTIKAAMDAADDFDTIVIPEGEYRLEDVITKSLTFVGAGTDKTVIVFKKSASNTTVTFNTQYVKFENCELRGESIPGDGGTYFVNGEKAEYLEINNCYINQMNTLIRIRNSEAKELNMLVNNCAVNNIGQFFIWNDKNFDNITILNTTFTDCGCVTNADGGIFRIRQGNILVKGCTFNGSSGNMGGWFERKNNRNGSFVVENCKFVDATKYIYYDSTGTMGLITFINNLYVTNDVVSTKTPDEIVDKWTAIDSKVMTTTDEFDALNIVGPKFVALFDFDGGVADAPKVMFTNDGSSLILPTATKENYLYAGWKLNEQIIYELPYYSTGVFHLTINWELNGVMSDIEYVLDEGTLPEDAPTKYMEGKGVETLPTPFKNGYRFDGWFVDDVEVTTIDTNSTGKVTLTAKWTQLASHAVTYVLDDGVNGDNPTMFYETQKAPLAPATKDGFKFFGWYDNGEFNGSALTEIDVTKKEDVTLYARFVDNNLLFNVTLELNGGSFRYENKAAIVNDFVKDYNFIMNKNIASINDISTESFNDIVFHTFYNGTLADGTLAKDKWGWMYQYVYDLSAAELASNNCNVLGLKHLLEGSNLTGDDTYGVSYGIRAFLKNTIIRPDTSYTSVNFTIPSKANGFWNYLSEAENNVISELYDDYVLPVAYNSVYTFDGWYKNEDFSGDKVTTVTKTDGSIKLYAKFVESNPVTAIEATNIVTEIEKLQTLQLEWALTPSNATISTVKFTSSDPTILKIDEKGLMTALALGTVTITITSDSQSKASKEYTVSVVAPERFVVSYETNSYVTVGEQIKLNAEYVLEDETTKTLVWSSSDDLTATVDAGGNVTGVKAGYVTIKATVSDNDTKYFEFTVTVVGDDVDPVIAEILKAHNSNIYTDYDLGIGSGKPAYYVDLIGSLSNVLFNDPLEIDTQYEALQAKNSANHGGTKASTEFITVHYTGNMSQGTGAQMHASYFANQSSTSIHYTTGSDGVYHILDDSLVGYHAGDGTGTTFSWSPTGVMKGESDPERPIFGIQDNYITINGTKSAIPVPQEANGKSASYINDMGLSFKVVDGQYYMGTIWWCTSQVAAGRICNHGGNNNSIGIETAVNPEGDLWYTWHKTAQLVAKLMLDNNLDITRVVGHHFFTAKDCPQPMLENELQNWYKFIEMVKAEYAILTICNDYDISMEVISDTNGSVLESESDFFSTANGRLVQKNTASSITYKVVLTKKTDKTDKVEIVLGSVLNGSFTK